MCETRNRLKWDLPGGRAQRCYPELNNVIQRHYTSPHMLRANLETSWQDLAQWHPSRWDNFIHENRDLWTNQVCRSFGESPCLSLPDISWTETLLYYSHMAIMPLSDVTCVRPLLPPLSSTHHLWDRIVMLRASCNLITLHLSWDLETFLESFIKGNLLFRIHEKASSKWQKTRLSIKQITRIHLTASQKIVTRQALHTRTRLYRQMTGFTDTDCGIFPQKLPLVILDQACALCNARMTKLIWF